ncbi:DUF3078 domain-containing protein [Flavobacterium sp.]|uniref:DUF3078 domain-containing protein n=1 Tax=Flavobacterium sp. TaxID=239 RepID=UPI0028BEE560|nr:DUF3078 domain-containing protein [Flavobacterium sp.]
MRKIVFALVCSFGLWNANAQDTEKENLKKNEEAIKKAGEERPNGWLKKGNFTLLASQSSFDNWLAGGQDNFAGNASLNYDLNYKDSTWTWDNKFIAAYGITKIKGADTQKTDDRIEINSLAGRKAFGKYWYYSMFFNFKTQMDAGVDPVDKVTTISHFFSPAYFQAGPGLLWKKSDNLKVNIAPATSKLIVVHGHFTDGLPDGVTYFGVKGNETTRYEFGAALNGYYKFNIMENVSVENILNLYSNYLEDPQNVDLDYQLNIVMKINKYLTTNFAFQTIYDDNAFRGFQTRQVIGLGFNYGF